MIELTNSLKQTDKKKILINPKHIVYVYPYTRNDKNYEGCQTYIEIVSADPLKAPVSGLKSLTNRSRFC